MAREIQYTKVLTDSSSFQLVRTNPKLTGNVKLTINESGEMWLNSIKANLELAKDDYSRFPIDQTQSLPANIHQFFKNGETPNEIIFSLTESIDLTKTSRDFKDQFDFSNYFSGIKYFPSNKYEERLSYFAPIYLKQDLPNYFIIFKMKDPLNNPIATDRANYESGQSRSKYLSELFKNATIVKTFDLSSTSKPGKYIRTYLNSPGFPVSPLTVSFNEDDYTTWNGILVNSGVFGSRGELFYSQYVQSVPLKSFEENITRGFERNGVIFPNILNLEFIFSDETAENYEFNRYLGLYVNSVELTKLDIDLARLYNERTVWPNSPKLRKQYYESDEAIVYQSNPTGVVLPCKNIDLNLSEFENIFTNSDSLYFNYLSDKDNRLHLPKLVNPYVIERSNEVSVSLTAVGTVITATAPSSHVFESGDLVYVDSQDQDYSGEFFITKLSSTQFTYQVESAPLAATALGSALQEVGQAKITLSDKEIDLGRFFGASTEIFLQDVGNASKIAGHSHAAGKILSQLSHLDAFKLYHPTGTRSDAGGKYDLFTGTANYSLVPDAGDYYAFNDYDNVTGFDTFYFNCTGLPREIAKAIEGCLNRVRNRDFTAYAYNDYVFIKCNVAGDFDRLHALNFSSFSAQYSSIKIGDLTGNSLIGANINFVGGSRPVGNRLVLDKKHLSKVVEGFDDILIRTAKDWSKIKKYSTYVDEINDVNQLTEASRAEKIAEYEGKMVIVLEDEEVPSINYTNFVMRKKFRPSFGFISMLPIKDLDFDFYTSEYLNFPLIDLYQHYFLPSDAKLLVTNTPYRVIGSGTVKIKGELVAGSVDTIDLNSLATGIVTSPISLTIGPGHSFLSGQKVIVEHSPNDYFIATVNSYSTFTGVIQLAFTTSKVIGTDAFSEWQVYQVAEEGDSFEVGEMYSQYSVILGDAFVSYDNATGANLAVPIFDENLELKDFEGFSILKDPSRVVAANTSDAYLLRTKYLNGLTETEYDFYKENDSRDFALRSKVLPYITKWKIKNGKDSRDNSYRLNTEIVFGRNNFAPDHTVRVQNPGVFTHEWFYIESNFNYLLDQSTVKQNDYYFEKPFDVTQALSDPNYFIEYFTYTPTLGAAYSNSGKDEEVGPTQLRYSSIYKNQAGNYETFFKGFKLEFKDVTDPNVLGEDGKPVAKSSTTRFEGYKFSCILKVVQEDFISLDVPPLKFKVVEHQDYKFIVVIIQVALNVIDAIDPYWFDSTNTYQEITNAPTTASTLFLGDNTSEPALGSAYPFETIQGDYRFTIDGNGISNLTHALLYSIKNKKYNSRINNFSTTKLSMKFNYTPLFNGVDFTTKTIDSIKNPNFPNYPALVSDEIVVPTDSTVLISKTPSSVYQLLDIKNAFNIPQKTSPIVGTNDNRLFFSSELVGGDLVLAVFSAPPQFTSSNQVLPIGPVFFNQIEANYLFELALGGQKYYEKLFEKLAFAKFKDYVNSLDPIIEYASYSLDSNGNSVLSNSTNFYVEIPDQEEIIKKNQLIANLDQDIPTQFAFNQSIGYTYEVALVNKQIVLNRYPGSYEPIAKDVLFCASNFTFTKNDIESIKLANIQFNANIEELLTVKNFNHIKVADTKILALEADPAYLPIYPLIGEVAIGQADYFLLAGNWDWGFHKKYSDKSTYFAVAGSLRVEEDESFMGKILGVPISLELESFELITLLQNQKLEDVDLSQIEMVVKEEATSVDGYINISNVITSYLLNQGIAQQFNNFLSNSNEYLGNYNSIEDYVKDYIKLNILKLYELETAEFYSLKDAQVVSNQSLVNINSVSFEFLDDAQRFANGYSLLKTTKINKTERLIISFSIPKILDAGLRVSPKIKIKFI